MWISSALLVLVASLDSTASAQPPKTALDAERDAVKWALDQAEGYRRPRGTRELALYFDDGSADFFDKHDFGRTEGRLPDGCRVGVTLLRLTNTRDRQEGGVFDDDLRVLAGLLRLESLSIASDHFTGKGLEHLAALPSLHRLSLDGPGLTDAGLASLGALKHLNELSVRKPLNPETVRLLSNLRELETLDLRFEAGGLAELAKLPKLRQLELSIDLTPDNARDLEKLQQVEGISCMFENDSESEPYFAAVAKLQKLREIAVFDPFNQSALRHLAAATGLRQLSLDMTADLEDVSLTASGLESLAALKQIHTLLYSGPLNNELLLAISKMAGLRELILDQSSSKLVNVSAEGWSHLKGLPFLTSLSVHVEDLALSAEDARQLAGLRALKKLTAWGMSDEALVEIAKSSQIRDLSFSGSGVTRVGLAAALRTPNLESLDWSGVTEPDDALATAKGLKSFSHSGLLRRDGRSQALSLNAMQALAGATTIETLYLGWLEIEPHDLELLARLEHLAELTLSGRQFGDAHLPAVTRCKGLKTLNLTGTSITGEGVAIVKKERREVRVVRSKH